MVLSPRRQRLNLPVAPLIAALVGGVTALLFALMPVGILEDFVIDSGIAAALSAAEPPLGATARAMLILVGGGGTALIVWFGLFLLLGSRSIVIQPSAAVRNAGKAPVLRRADAHPDAPARRPLFANSELGTPFLEVRAGRGVHAVAKAETKKIDMVEPEPLPAPAVERDLPADLNVPLAAFDPHAIPEEPADWFPSPAPLLRTPRQQLFDPGERFETFELTPMVRSFVPPPPAPSAAPIHAPEVPHALAPWPIASERLAAPARPRDSARVEKDPSASIHALLDRLERGVGRREIATPAPREESLQEALVTLRRLAVRG